MKLREIFELIKNEFDEAITINSIESINQNGLYLIFDGCQKQSAAKDTANFSLVIAANSLEANNFTMLEELEKLRRKLFVMAAAYGQSWYKDIKAAKFEGSTLYVYVIGFEVEIDAA
ncbi:hypothetical protein [Campylobacter sp. RM9328]|uniref:hypothetical protein n=1 Tax=Campylobacter sp. RM9328 TaxID=1705720 RepID=UPI00147456D1|nr:hypothetical protein [Campylobacter sp. RM9328]